MTLRESGWQSGKELDFYPTNPGLTPTRVFTTKKKDHQKVPSVPFMTSSRKSYLKVSKKTHLFALEVTMFYNLD